MEKCAESKLVVIKQTCDKCKLGEMLPDTTSPVLTSYPPQYPHICNNCGAKEYYPQVYPYQVAIRCEEYRDFTDEELEKLGKQRPSSLLM